MSGSDYPAATHEARPGWPIDKAETGLYVVYVFAVTLMLGCYFVHPPAERWDFYRRTFSEWIAIARFVLHGGGAQPVRPEAARVPVRSTIPPGQAAIGYLDQPQGEPVIRIEDGGEIHISGWAACSNASSPLTKAEILVDDRVRADAALSFPRPDVSEAFGRPDFDHSGWKASFRARSLGIGTHQIGARVTCAGGETGTLPAFRLVVTAK